MINYDFKLSDGKTVIFHYNPDAPDPKKCITEYSGNLNFGSWPEVLDGLLTIYDHHARSTGKSFVLRWKLKSGREIAYSISPHRKAQPISPQEPEPTSPDEIRARIAAKLSPELLAEAIGSLPMENAKEIIRTYLTPHPTKRIQRINIQKP